MNNETVQSTTRKDMQVMAKDKGKQNTGGEETGENEGSGEAAAFDYDTFHGTQDKATQAGLTAHTSGMKSAMEKIKEDRNSLREEVKRINKSSATDTDKTTQMQAALEASEQRAGFYENLPADIMNPRAAYLLAKDTGMLRTDGSLDTSLFKERFPEQFREVKKIKTKSDAGTGTDSNSGGGGKSKKDGGMNAMLRRAAGRE